VNAVMNLTFHKMQGFKDLLASPEGLCSMELVTVMVNYYPFVQTLS
jgi:hypothetical protein